MECDKEKNSTLNDEGADVKSPKTIIGETVKHCLDDVTNYDIDVAEQSGS